MLCVRGVQRLKAALNPRGIIRSRSLTSDGVHHKDDMIVKMENPYKEPPKVCILCNVTVDFKNIQLLSQFISPHTGRIYGRHITGLCGRKQKEISKAIKKAHALELSSRASLKATVDRKNSLMRKKPPAIGMIVDPHGFMSVTHKHPQFMRDPNICGIKHLY